jgi:hypothetical protein
VLAVAAPVRAEDSARTRAEATLKSLEARPQDKALVASYVARAQKALERAASARRAGDQGHGSQLEALALELAEAGADLMRTHAAENQATASEEKALDLETKVVRARALVEQAAARRGRASERLRAVEAEKGKVAPAASGKANKVPAATDPKTAAPPAKSPLPAAKTPAPAATPKPAGGAKP